MGVLYHFPMRMFFPILLGVLPLPLLSSSVLAETFLLPPVEFDLVGVPRVVKASQEDTLLDIARRYDIGQEEILHANPEVDRWLPGAGTEVTIPSHYVLPSTPRNGLVLNTPEMRIYYFPEPKPGEPAEVQTYPVSIGRMDWATPLGETRLITKEKDPAWRPPESIRAEHEADGDPLPRVVPPGPDNPLGGYAMRLGLPGYLIHGTNKAFGVGMRVSHGCIRMLPEDIEMLYPQVPVGTLVRIINQPAKAGWYGDKLFLEVHPPLDEDQSGWDSMTENVMNVIDEAQFRRLVELDMQAIERAIADQSGLPVVISADN